MEGTAHATGWLVEGAKSSSVFMVTGDKGEVGAEESGWEGWWVHGIKGPLCHVRILNPFGWAMESDGRIFSGRMA